MTDIQTVFVGDIHGNLAALNGLIEILLHDPTVDKIVFLGDYINKGHDPAGVIARLFQLAKSGSIVLLRGNHEEEMLAALNTGDLATFLKKGGAATIRSYLGRPASPDVLVDFRDAVPAEHIQFLSSMSDVYETTEIRAAHRPNSDVEQRFQISAHIPVGDRPIIDDKSAQLDTNCGSPTGRLTAFYWPDRRYIQVDSSGDVVRSTRRRTALN